MSKTKSFYWDSIEQGLNHTGYTNYTKHQSKPPLEAHREHLEQAREGAKYIRSQELKKRLLERFRAGKGSKVVC